MWSFYCAHPSCSHDHGFCIQSVVTEPLLWFTGRTKGAGSGSNGRGYCSCRGRTCPPGWRPLIGWTRRTREAPPACSGGWVMARLGESKDIMSMSIFYLSKGIFNLRIFIGAPHLVWWWCVPGWRCRAVTQAPLYHSKVRLWIVCSPLGSLYTHFRTSLVPVL